MNRTTATTMKPMTWASAFRLCNTTPYESSWPFSAVLMNFQLDYVWTYMDLCVYHGILATNINLVARCTAKAVAYSQNLHFNFKKLSRKVIKTFQGNEQ